MAEQDTDVVEQDVDISGGNDDLEAMIDAELDRPSSDEKKEATKDAEKKEVKDGSGTGDDKKPPETKPATETSNEEKAFLRDAGFSDEEIKEVTPKELERLKKAHGFYSGVIKKHQDRAEFFGKSNKDLSERYQAQQKTLKEVMAQQSPADRMKGRIGKIDMSKLSDGAKKLVEDPEFLEAMSLFFDAPHAEASPASSESPKTQQTEDEAKAATAENIKFVESSDLIKSKHPDIAAVYTSPEFLRWTETLSDYELMKVFSRDPRAHDEILTRYKAEQASAEVSRQQKAEQEKKNAALRAHGASAGAGAREVDDDLSPSDIMSGGKAFDAMTERIRKRRTGG